MKKVGDLVGRIFGPEGEDAGCEACFNVLDEYVEGELQGQPVEERFPDVATHLAACPDCGQDHEGLVALATDLGR